MQPYTVRNIATQCESIHIALETSSHPPEENDSPTAGAPGSRGPTKKGTASRKKSLSVIIALDSDTDSSKDSDAPLPKSTEATVKSKKGMHTKGNLRGTCILVLCNYTRA